jgi:uncharacterized protein with HEPN domain
VKEIDRLLQDMLDSIASIGSFKIKDYESFLADEKTQDAVMYNLIILGEAANTLPEDFRLQHLEIPWPSIIGTRNIIVHGYNQVKLQIVWDILEKDLLSLENNLRKLL